jgi:hypothetical protein
MDANSTKQLSSGMRLYLTKIFPLILVLVGAWLLYFGGGNLLRASQSKTWSTTQGEIQSSSMESRSTRRGNNYRAKTVYNYTVNEKTLRGYRIIFGYYGSSNRSYAQDVVNRYPQGKSVTVYYNPQDPNVCVLEAGVKGQVWFLPGLGLVSLVAGIIIAVFSPKILRKHAAVESGTQGDD